LHGQSLIFVVSYQIGAKRLANCCVAIIFPLTAMDTAAYSAGVRAI
jgi:hypothetical protein